MGYTVYSNTMESRVSLGSASSRPKSSPGMKGQNVKSSLFCSRTSSKWSQFLIKDHMLSHYKRVYSAKAAVDTAAPKIMERSGKRNDQLRQEWSRKGARPQSAHSLSQRNSRASCSSTQSRLSLQYDDIPYLGSRSSVFSSPGFSTSFPFKKTVYPTSKGDSQNHVCLPTSKIKYQSREATSHTQQSTYSLEATRAQTFYKTFQDPVQKTYSGDLLQKHSQLFTQDKPFTPKTLKSEKSSYLSQYRYYRAPQRKPAQDCLDAETFHGTTTQETDERSQGCITDHEWPEDDLNDTHLSASRQHSQTSRSRECDFFDSLSRVSPDGKKSPLMTRISAEEEELMYLEFITAVTEDILSRGYISDRILDRVMKQHIDMNRYHLDEDKMRHLLGVLRKELEEPSRTSSCSPKLERKEINLLDAFLPQLEGLKHTITKEDNDLFHYASLIKNCDMPDYADPLMYSTPLCSPERTASMTNVNESEGEDGGQEKGRVPNNASFSDEDLHQNQMGTAVTNTDSSNKEDESSIIAIDEGFHQDQAEVKDGELKELEDLGRNFLESLHVSENARCENNMETVNEQQTSTVTVSDDEF